MSKETTNKEVAKAWSEKIGRNVDFKLREVETHDGRKQTQLVNTESGSVVVAVNQTGSDAVDTLVERAGDTFIDAAFDVLEVEGPNKANQLDKSDNDVKTPSDRPGPALEAEKSKDAGSLAEDKE